MTVHEAIVQIVREEMLGTLAVVMEHLNRPKVDEAQAKRNAFYQKLNPKADIKLLKQPLKLGDTVFFKESPGPGRPRLGKVVGFDLPNGRTYVEDSKGKKIRCPTGRVWK
jgi:hypothetical protein